MHCGLTLAIQNGSTNSETDFITTQWIIEEKNAELRRVLIQEIGYARIADELQADEWDSWAEYTLLKIDRADIEPIYLLKMTCPSTEYIHALRVPPNLQSAREAIRWINWGIAPEEFQEQTWNVTHRT